MQSSEVATRIIFWILKQKAKDSLGPRWYSAILCFRFLCDRTNWTTNSSIPFELLSNENQYGYYRLIVCFNLVGVPLSDTNRRTLILDSKIHVVIDWPRTTSYLFEEWKQSPNPQTYLILETLWRMEMNPLLLSVNSKWFFVAINYFLYPSWSLSSKTYVKCHVVWNLVPLQRWLQKSVYFLIKPLNIWSRVTFNL